MSVAMYSTDDRMPQMRKALMTLDRCEE